MSELETGKRWWHSWITPQTLILAIGIALTLGGWLRDKQYIEMRQERSDLRLTQIEERFVEERVESDRVYMRKDNVELELKAIRVEIQGLRRDLR